MTWQAQEAEADRAAARGDVAGAAALLEGVAQVAPPSIDRWLKLASLRRAAGRPRLALHAIDAALALDPLHFMALISRAHVLEAEGEGAEAARTYLRALAQLPEGQALPARLSALVAHARAVGDRYVAEEAATRRAIVADLATLSDTERRRLERFNSNVLHRTRVYHSEPTHYHYPGLVEREFHDRDAFPWLADLEAATDAIRDEFLALQTRGDARAEPYIQYDASLPTRQWTALNHSADWTAFHLIQNGCVVEENAARCPRAMEMLTEIDQPKIAGRGPNAMFSVLKPHTRIPPHTGVANTRLVCHLPLIVPPRCWFRVGAETRGWEPGQAFVFDDTIEHEAANDSGETRVVFIVDCWHPGLSPAERGAVAALMEAEEAAGGAPL